MVEPQSRAPPFFCAQATFIISNESALWKTGSAVTIDRFAPDDHDMIRSISSVPTIQQGRNHPEMARTPWVSPSGSGVYEKEK